MIIEKFTDENLIHSINIVNKEISSFRTQNILKKSIRVFYPDGRFGLSSALGEVSDADLTESAKKNADFGFKYQYELEKDTQGTYSRGNINLHKREFLLSETEEIVKDLKSIAGKKFSFSDHIHLNKRIVSLENSQGVKLSRTTSTYDCGLMLKRIGSPDLIDGFIGISSYEGIDKDKFYQEADVILKAISSDVITLNHDNMPIVFFGKELLSHFNSDVNGKSYFLGNSLLVNKLGTQIMHPDINIYDQHDDQASLTYSPFDHEGIVRKEVFPLVENGIFKNIYLDKKTAQKYGKISTGNGFRSYDSNPGCSSRTISLSYTHDSLTELSKGQTLLLVYLTSGGDTLPTGDFSFPVQIGFYFKDGKIIGKAPQLTITGNYLKALNEDFICVAKNDFLPENFNLQTIVCKSKISLN